MSIGGVKPGASSKAADAQEGCLTESTLADFLSGLLTDEERGGVEGHIDGCEDCRVLLSVLAQARTVHDGSRKPEATWRDTAGPVTAAPEGLSPGETLAARFQIEDRAAAGGMGVIYRARDRRAGEQVAIKVLERRSRADTGQFEREAQILAELRHPGIVRYVCHGALDPERLFLAMEWLDGVDLARRLERGRLRVADSIVLAERVATALAAAHGRGIVHRDIKPRNLFLPAGDVTRVKVLDFGLAALARSDGRPQIVGTPGYMSPEQARGDPRVDARADVYALGCVLFECLTGRPAFVADRMQALFAKIVAGQAPRLADACKPTESDPVPAALEELVARLMARDPGERPEDGAAVARELETIRVGMEWVPPTARTPAAAALGAHELRLVSAVLAGAPSAPVGEALEVASAGRAAIAALGGRIETLRDGTLLVTVTGAGAATDQAARAARTALELRRRLRSAPIAVATGRTHLTADELVGDAIDRAAELVEAPAPDAAPAAIRIDAVTAGLLGPHFEVVRDALGATLRSEQEPGAIRTLLGRATPFVGRERELSRLERIFEDCTRQRTPRAVLVTGDAGMGKSRLRHELVRRLRSRVREVWLGWADATGAGSAFALAADVLTRVADVRRGETIARKQAKIRARVAQSVAAADVPRVTQFLAELLAARFDGVESAQLRAARQDAMLMGDQIRRAWLDFTAAECAAGPLLLVLEDLQWGDAPTVQLVDDLLRVHDRCAVMVLALARPEAMELFPGLWSARPLEQIALGPLAPDACEALARHALGDAHAESVGTIVEQAAGNPYYLEELVRAAAEPAAAERTAGSAPATVVAMTQARLEALAPEARRVLRAASIFGRSFSLGGVAALLSGELDADGWLQELGIHEVVFPRATTRFEGETELAFRHELVREAAYAMLTDDDRVLGHRLAAEWLERAGEADALVLAGHYERGDERTRAAACYLRGAEQALEGNDLSAALERAERADACGAEGRAMGTLHRIQAEVHRWLGNNGIAEGHALEAMAALPEGGDEWHDAARTLACAAGNLGHVERVVALCERLRTPDRSLSGPAVVARVHTATELLGAARYQLAAELLDETERRQDESLVSDPEVVAHVRHARAIQAFLVGDPADYVEHMAEAAAHFERAGDQRNSARSRVNLGFGHRLLGEPADAERCLRSAFATAEHMGLPHVSALAKHNLGMVLADNGSLREAIAIEGEAAEAFARQGHRRMEGASRDYLAVLLQRAGELEAAEREARAAVELLSLSRTRAPRALAVLAQVLLARGRRGEALDAAERAIELASGIGWVPEQPFLRMVHAETLHENGDGPGARAAIARARESLLEAAGRIRDPARRASFLENVPEHARALALARAWLA